MAITDYIPNVFGSSAPTTYEGLLGMGLITPEQMKKQQNVANIQGLLGAGLALAQGMSKIGPRRSAAENIFGALAGGFGAAGGAYQQGLQNVVQQQQLVQAQLAQQDANIKRQQLAAQQQAVEQLIKSPEIANDPLKIAFIRANPNEALKMYSEILPFQQAIQQQGAPQAQGAQVAGTTQPTTPVSPLEQKMAEKKKIETYISSISSNPIIAGTERGSRALKAYGDQLTNINNEIKLLRLSGISTLTGNETPAQLRTLALEADELGNKSLADNLLAIASRKELEPPVPKEPKPEDLVKQDMAKRAEMPQAPVRTKAGSILNAKPNWEAGEEYVDEELNKKFRPVTELPPTEVVADRGRLGQLQRQIDDTDKEIKRLSKIPTNDARDSVRNLIQVKESLQKDLNRLAVMEYDFKSIKEGLPKKYQSEISDIEKLAQTGTLDAAGLRSSIQTFYDRLQQDEKGRKLEGNAATFAQMKFGVTDRAQLTGPQLAEILRFENAPTAQQIAQLEQANKQLTLDNIKTQFETGRGIGTVPTIPTGREDLLTAPAVVSTAVPTVAPAVNTAAITPTAADVTQTTPVVTSQVAPVTTNQVATTTQRVAPRVATDAAPRVVTETAPRVSPENAPVQTRELYKYNKEALINQPDSKFPPRQKVELRAKKAASASAVNYGLTAIVDARDAALALRNNPVYIEALTGRTSPLRSQTIGGVILDRDAYTAGQLLQNILTRNFVTEIQKMRESSPTGGAVGSVTEKEMEALSKIAATLSVGMNKDALIRELDNYLRIANRSITTIPTAYAKTYGYAGEFDDLLTRITINPTPVVPRPSGQRPGSTIPPDVRRRYGLQ